MQISYSTQMDALKEKDFSCILMYYLKEVSVKGKTSFHPTWNVLERKSGCLYLRFLSGCFDKFL